MRPSGSQPALRGGPARSLQPLPPAAAAPAAAAPAAASGTATATAPAPPAPPAPLPVSSRELAASSPQRLPPPSTQPVGLRSSGGVDSHPLTTSQSAGALGAGRPLGGAPPPSPGSTVLRGSRSAG